jgi:DNA-binding transcriptional LysR family regulator
VPDWNDYRYFLAIQRTGTLAGAARELKVDHTTVGRRLTALERALGAKLFTRSPEGFRLTDAGARIVPAAERIEREAQALEHELAGTDQRPAGTVRLTCSEAFAGFLLPRLGELRVRYPDIDVQLLTTNAVVDLVRGEADLAIRIAPTTQDQLVMRKLADGGWTLFASAEYVTKRGAPASAENLAGHDVVAFAEHMSNVPGALWLTAHGAGANVVLRCNSISSVRFAVLAGLGLSVLPCFLCDSEPQLKRLTPRVLGGREISLVLHPDLQRVARVRAVADFLVELFKREETRLAGKVA